jgi:hypothetical protein
MLIPIFLGTKFKDPKVLLHVLLTICGLAPTTALWSYAPTIVGSFGYGRLEANALVSVGQWISVCLIVVAAFAASVPLPSPHECTCTVWNKR